MCGLCRLLHGTGQDDSVEVIYEEDLPPEEAADIFIDSWFNSLMRLSARTTGNNTGTHEAWLHGYGKIMRTMHVTLEAHDPEQLDLLIQSVPALAEYSARVAQKRELQRLMGFNG